MALDALVANPGRLKILTSLAVAPSQEFVQLRQRTSLTDGNLSTHARRLKNAGLLAIEKTFRAGKPVTTFTLTTEGRRALESHVRGLMDALNLVPGDRPVAASSRENGSQDEWFD
jgi:DNA-binding MarR family transcriptional regulator